MKVSVCIATYNGEKYLKKQLQSIVCQLRPCDEIVISDDSSSDKTVNIIQSFEDKRIRFIGSFNFKSPIYNFENAIKSAQGDIIILADQDDLWLPGRLESAVTVLKDEQIDLVVCRCELINSNDEVIGDAYFNDTNPVKKFLLPNLYRNPYLGCALAFKRKILHFALPFPRRLAMHDIWLGIVTQSNGKCVYYEKALVQYRLHDNNYTKKSPFDFFGKIGYRIYILYNIYYRKIMAKMGKN